MNHQRGLTLYLHVHQPWRVRDYTIFDTAANHQYFSGDSDDDRNNRRVFEKVADKSYRPMNQLLLGLLDSVPEFRLSLSITGTFLEQAEAWAPDVIEQLQQLVATGRVEIVAETYHHSLAFFYSLPEFERQVSLHRQAVERLFAVTPTAFRNTELAYSDDLAKWADEYGYQAILAEGWDPVLDWRSPNFVYRPPGTDTLRLLLKNYRLSDDLAFRFGDKSWRDQPLTVEKYRSWIEASLDDAQLVNLFMDYETFGEHQWRDTGIFKFFEQFVHEWASSHRFYTVTEAAQTFEPVGELAMPSVVTWADSERDLTAWLGNDLQREAVRYLYELEDAVLRSDDAKLIDDWRKLQTSDHFYYMCTKWFRDGDVHAYFSPYDSPYDAFLYYMNVIRDMRYRVMAQQKGRF